MAVGRVNVGGSLAGQRNINVIASSAAPVASKYGDVWLKTTNVIGKTIFQEIEPSSKALGDIWINIGNIKSKFNIKDAMKFIGRSEIEINVVINSADVLAQIPSAPNVEFWKSAAMSLYSVLGSVRYWDGTKWVFLIAYYWNGASWTNFSQADWYTYVADADCNVYKISPTGEVTVFYAGASTIYGIDTDPQGNVYFNTSNKIFKYSPAGAEIWNCVPTGSILLQDLQLDKDGNIYVSNNNYNKVFKLSPEGIVIFTNTLATGGSLALDKDGQMYCAIDSGQLGKFSADGTNIWIKTLYSTSTSLNGNATYSIVPNTEDGSVLAYNGYKNTIYKFSADGLTKTTPFVATTATDLNDACMVRDKDYLYFVAWIFGSGAPSKLVQKLDINTFALAWSYDVYALTGGYAVMVTVDKDGYVYVATTNNKFVKLTSNGTLVWQRVLGADTTKRANAMATTPCKYAANPIMW
jgi:hypothetical protein